jgi:hypothetical protein
MSAAAGRLAAAIFCVALLAACAGALDHPVPGGPSYESDDFRFVAPRGWQIHPSTAVFYGGHGDIRLYLANQPLRQDCPTSGTIITCESPLANGLRRGGMLVTWWAETCVAHGCDLPPATLMAIGNRQGVRVPMNDLCDGTGSTERSAYYATVTPQRVDILFVCAREPADATRSAFLGFLDAIQWRIP